MATAVSTTSQKVHDSELAEWLGRSSDDERELIVEAAVPRRKVSFRTRAGGRLLPADVESSGSRNAVLDELWSYLNDLLATPPTLLRAAGALAVRASGREAQLLLDHPLVRSLKWNRKRYPPPASRRLR